MYGPSTQDLRSMRRKDGKILKSWKKPSNLGNTISLGCLCQLITKIWKDNESLQISGMLSSISFLITMLIPSEPSDIRHDFHGLPASREMPRATPTAMHGIYPPHKRFGSVNYQALWKTLSKICCPKKFANILRLLHDGMTTKVLTALSETEAFEVKTDVKQGYIIAPTHFSIFIAAIIHLVKDKIHSGVDIDYWLDRKLFNLSHLRKPTLTSLVELQYADDNSTYALSKEEFHVILDIFCRSISKKLASLLTSSCTWAGSGCSLHPNQWRTLTLPT